MLRPTLTLALLTSVALAAMEPASTALSQAEIIDRATAGSPDSHCIEACAHGARVSCALQALEGILDSDGLRLTSVGSAAGQGEIAVRVVGLGRVPGGDPVPVGRGTVQVIQGLAVLRRPSVSEEGTSSAGGIRQDFLIHAPPPGQGLLDLCLDLAGATVTACEPQRLALRLDGGRELVWHGLHVSDAAGAVLSARFHHESGTGVSVRFDDSGAAYPIRIDPTFTDADWVGFGPCVGMNDRVYALAISGSDLYAGGEFTTAG